MYKKRQTVASKEPELCPNEYRNIFWCPRVDWRNTQTYLDAQELTKQISKYIRIEKKPQIRRIVWGISFEYSNELGFPTNDPMNIQIY